MTIPLPNIRSIILVLCLFFLQINGALSQNNTHSFSISGVVSEQNGTKERTPIPYASISANAYGLATHTDESGKFILEAVPSGKMTIHISYLGKIAIDTVIVVNRNLNLEFLLAEANFRLKEVSVTAENIQSGQGTSSKVSRMAIDHLQANSLGDVMSLLPGGLSSNPTLSSAGQITIRQITIDSDGSKPSSQAKNNAFGTSIVLNGAPMSNNANLQSLSPSVQGNTQSLADGAAPGSGFDTRGISMDNVESIEVIRGIPGVEYGDVTSGVVLVNTKAGVQPLFINTKTNPNVYQFSATKGTDLGMNKGALNLGIDYARNVKDPVQSYLTYERFTANALYTNYFFGGLNSTTSIDLIYGKDTHRLNLDDIVTQTSSSGRDLGFIWNTRGELSFKDSWLRRINYVARIGYTAKNSFYQTQHTAATAPYSMTLTDGTILSNNAGKEVFDASGNKLTNIEVDDRDLYAFMLPSTYIGKYAIDGKELNTYIKAIATFYNKVGSTHNRWRIGVDYKTDSNFGKGKHFSNEAPPYRNLSAVNASFRPRVFNDIPTLNQVGIFAEDQFSTRLGSRDLQVSAGLRYDHFSGNRTALSPRINTSFELLPGLLSLNAAYGSLAKAPALLYISPEDAYFEYININETASNSIPVDQQVLMTTTRVFSTENKDLTIAKNEKIELGFLLKIKQASLNVTAFSERLRNGYILANSLNSFKPLVYNEYIRSGEGSLPVFDLKESNPVLAKFSVPTNNMVSHTKGLEFDLDLGRFEAIRSRFSINGAWLNTESYNKDFAYYDGQSSTGGAGRTHIGLYESNKRNDQALITALRTTHNIPQIGFVLTLTTQVVWNESNWTTHGNDSIPVQYISKNDGQLYHFDTKKKDDPEFKTLLAPVNQRAYIKESFPPLVSFNINLTKEISDYMRASFFANNMFRHYQITESKSNPGTFLKRNSSYFFGLELSLTLK